MTFTEAVSGPAGAPIPVHTLNASRSVAGQKWVVGRGPSPAPIMILDSYPGKDEAERGLAHIGRVASSFRKLVVKAAIDEKSIYWTYVVKYRPEKSTKRSDVSADDIERCREVFEKEIEKVKPKYIITTGSVALKYFMGRHYSVDDFKACLLHPPGRDFRIFVMADPSICVSSPELVDDVLKDLKFFREIFVDPVGFTSRLSPAQYSTIGDIATLKSFVDWQLSQNFTLYSVDCEWGMGNFKTGLFRSMQLCWTPRQAVYIRFLAPGGAWGFDAPEQVVYAELRRLLNRPEVRYIGHNISEDFLWMQRIGLEVIGRCVFDTMYAAHLCNEYETVGLERLSVRYTPLGRYDLALMQEIREKEIDVENRGYIDLSDEVIIPYGCTDVDVVMLTYPVFKERLKEQNLEQLYYEEVLPVATDVGIELKASGLPMDVVRLEELTQTYNKRYESMRNDLKERMKADAFARFIQAAGKVQLDVVLEATSLYANTISPDKFEEYIRAKVTALQWSSLEPFVKHLKNCSYAPKVDQTYDSDEAGDDMGGFNINSPDHLEVFLFRVLGLTPLKSTGKPSCSWSRVLMMPVDRQKTYRPSTDSQTLEILRDDDPLVQEIWRTKKVGNIIKSFLRKDHQGLHKYIHTDGRLYYDISFLTETGRGRTWSPNAQNWPKKADAVMKEIFGKDNMPPSIRSCVIAPEGYVLLEADYIAAELFVAAYLSGDTNMIGALTSPDPNYVMVMRGNALMAVRESTLKPEERGMVVIDDKGQPVRPKRDLHWEMAEEVANKIREALDKDKDRVAAKSGNFGIPYGMIARTFARKVRAETGQPYSEEEAEKFIEGHKRKFPQLHDYLEQQERIVYSEVGGGVSTNAYGRKRRFYLGPEFCDLSEKQQSRLTGALGRESRNFPIQSYVGDSINVACVLFTRLRNHMKLQTKLLLILHDALLFLVPESEVETVKKLVATCMSDATVHNTLGGVFRLDTEIEIYKRWTEKIKHK